jgi:hypothetical protein
VRGRPPLDDEHRGLVVEVGVHDLGDVGPEAVAVRALGGLSAAGDLRLARPLRLGALGRVDGGAVQREPRIAAQVGARARVRHRAEDQLAVLEDGLDPGDPGRPVGAYGGNCLVSMCVEQPTYAGGELRRCLFDVLPCRHVTMIAPTAS